MSLLTNHAWWLFSFHSLLPFPVYCFDLSKSSSLSLKFLPNSISYSFPSIISTPIPWGWKIPSQLSFLNSFSFSRKHVLSLLFSYFLPMPSWFISFLPPMLDSSFFPATDICWAWTVCCYSSVGNTGMVREFLFSPLSTGWDNKRTHQCVTCRVGTGLLNITEDKDNRGYRRTVFNFCFW